MLESFFVLTAVFSAAVAAVAGFGIGSFLTPALSLVFPVKTAVALVAVPHLLAAVLRLFVLRKNIDRGLFLRFGLASAAGGLFGAWLHSLLGGAWLSAVLGVLLILSGLLGFGEQKLRLRGPAVWAGGVASGIFGGLVGNQGGIRAAALLSFDLRKETFVAVSTAAAFLVDLARLPFYAADSGEAFRAHAGLVLLLCAGVAAGTLLGMKGLGHIPQERFYKVVSALLVLLGIFMLIKAIRSPGAFV